MMIPPPTASSVLIGIKISCLIQKYKKWKGVTLEIIVFFTTAIVNLFTYLAKSLGKEILC